MFFQRTQQKLSSKDFVLLLKTHKGLYVYLCIVRQAEVRGGVLVVLDMAKKWAGVFSILGSGERLSIMIVLQGSKYIRHSHGSSAQVGCLSFSQIRESAEISSDTMLSYHLSKLMGAGLIRKFAVQDDKGRVFPLYSVSEKWQKFSSELGLDAEVKAYIKKKYPEAFTEEG